MASYKIRLNEKECACPVCGYTWEAPHDLSFNEKECVPCCPDCSELIEDGGDYD